MIRKEKAPAGYLKSAQKIYKHDYLHSRGLHRECGDRVHNYQTALKPTLKQ